MVSSWCAGSLLFVAFCSSIVCPFYTKTIRGVLCLHWTIINFLISTSGFHPTDAGCLLIALATLLSFLEHTANQFKPEYLLSPFEQVSLICFLLCFDAACAVYGQLANTEISLLILCAHVTLSVYVAMCHRRRERNPSTQQRIEHNSGDIFVDATNPFAFLGLHGFHYAVIVFDVVAQVPSLRSHLFFQNIIYIVRSTATLGLIFSPAFLGGLVHALKTGGAKLAERRKCNLRKSLIVNA